MSYLPLLAEYITQTETFVISLLGIGLLGLGLARRNAQ